LRELFSFIFDKLTDPLGLPIAVWKEWLILLILGELAYRNRVQQLWAICMMREIFRPASAAASSIG
jgi:hypothetical protein